MKLFVSEDRKVGLSPTLVRCAGLEFLRQASGCCPPPQLNAARWRSSKTLIVTSDVRILLRRVAPAIPENAVAVLSFSA